MLSNRFFVFEKRCLTILKLMNLLKLPSLSSEMHQTLNVHIWKFKVVNIRHLDMSRNYMTSYYVTIYFSADLRLCTEPDNG